MDVERLNQLAKHLDGLDHKDFDMSAWECGTAACIAGWTVRLFHEDRDELPEECYFEVACEMLDLTDEQGCDLFTPASAIAVYATPREGAAAVRDMIDGYIPWNR